WHRHPIVMAKMLTTIDTLSNGRLICGFGVGWWAEEFAALGIPFHTRGRQGDEMLRVCKELWTSENPQFDGEFYRFSNIGFAPKPVQKPHPPLWIGGNSPGAFRRVATLGEGWPATSQSPDQLRHSLERLKKAAGKSGRALNRMELSLALPRRSYAVGGSTPGLFTN